MSETKDTIKYNGDEFAIQSGLTEADIRESMSTIYASVGTADIEKTANDDGSFTWRISERAGDKG